MRYLYNSKDFKYTNTDDRKFEQFFVCKYKNVYIMDNHRAALWCWINESKNASDKLKLLHIDNHPDMSPRGLHCDCSSKIKLEDLDIKKYLEYRHDCQQYGSGLMFSYENFLRCFIQNYSKIINSTNVFITHSHWEIKPDVNLYIENYLKKYLIDSKPSTDCSQLVNRIYKDDLFKLFDTDENFNWIIDLDFDYFYNDSTHTLNFELAEKVFHLIKDWYDMGKVTVFTVAWSPEFLFNRRGEGMNSGLEKAKKMNALFCKIFKLDFKQL